ncbi:MAG: hypothetical protein ACXIUZ_01560 [Lysobacteraceae bacterium]
MSDDRLKDAWRETERILEQEPSRSIADPTLPVYRIAAEAELAEEHARFEAGDRTALMGAIRVCANHDMVLPEWVSTAFIRSYDQVLTRKVASWDEALGRPLPKGKHLAAARKKRNKAPAVWLEINRLHAAGRGIDDELFSEVGHKLGLGRTLVAEYYAAMKARWGGTKGQ